MANTGKKTLGQAIDEIIAALESIDESARATAIRAACEHVGIEQDAAGASVVERALSSGGGVGAGSDAVEQHATRAALDIRTLKEQKAPTSAIEMACLVAYYLDTLASPPERKKDVAAADMERYFKQANYRLPKRMPQLLVNARAAGYFDSPGHGKYRLNPVGHNLVVHGLPKTKQ